MTDSKHTQQPSEQGDQHSENEQARLKAHLEEQAEEQFRRQMRQATHFLINGRGKEALPLLERCYDLHPDDVNVLTNLGSAYILMERFADAIPMLVRATELDPRNPAAWVNLAAAYLGRMYTTTRAKQDKALEAYQRAAAIEPHYPNLHYNMGLIYIEQRAWEAAHVSFMRALESNPHDRDAKTMLARVEKVLNAPPRPENN